jgi:hypothetical protein
MTNLHRQSTSQRAICVPAMSNSWTQKTRNSNRMS